ncbi:MAG: hypothetical protein ACJAWC_003369 [Yoonia sp.]|jgi:hypothetical protein
MQKNHSLHIAKRADGNDAMLVFRSPLWAYSVEKLRHAKIASEIWNAVPTIG